MAYIYIKAGLDITNDYEVELTVHDKPKND